MVWFMLLEAIKFAAKGSISRANAWAPVAGALILWGGTYMMGYEVAVPSTWPQGIAMFLACLGAAWVVIFFGRLLYAPYHLLKAARASLAAGNYAYALALERLEPSWDRKNARNTLEIRLVLHNTTGGPVKYLVESLTTDIAGNVVTTKNKGGVIPANKLSTFFPAGGLTQHQFNAAGNRPTGTVRYSILYGHPNEKFARRAVKEMRLDVFKHPKNVSINWYIDVDDDIAV